MSEHAEFLKYYEKYRDKIFTYFMYRVNFNHAQAEDLTSEVFIKAFENFESYDQTRSFGSWVYAIAKNHLSNFYRSKKQDVDLESIIGLSVEIDKKIEDRNELENVFKKINELDPYSRDVLLMRFVDGLDNNEIAEIMEKDEGSIRTQISRALKKIRNEKDSL